MFGKIAIKGNIELVTGMHIGTGGEFAAIGAVDSPVIRDALAQLPIIPGSSLKGKLRSVLARKYNKHAANIADDDCDEIKRLFGSQKSPSRLIFSDMILANKDELETMNVFSATEIKFENTINRLTGVANPRQIERTIRGCHFGLELTYNYSDEKEAVEDMTLLADGMKLLQFDYLGGHGSRGYGKIAFKDISAEAVVGDINGVVIEKINEELKKVGC